MNQQCAFAAKVDSSILGCIGQSAASGAKEVIPSLCSALRRHCWSVGSCADLPNIRKSTHTGTSPAKGHDGDEGIGAIGSVNWDHLDQGSSQ